VWLGVIIVEFALAGQKAYCSFSAFVHTHERVHHFIVHSFM